MMPRRRDIPQVTTIPDIPHELPYSRTLLCLFITVCSLDGMFYRHIERGLSSCSVWPKLGIRSAPFTPSLQVSCEASSSFTKVVTSSISRRSTSPGWMVQLIPSACQCGGMLGFEDLSNSGNLELRHGDEHALPARTSSWFHKFHVAIWYCRVLISYRLYGSPIGTTRLDGTALGSLVLKIWNERCDDFCFTSTPSGTCSRILPAQQMVLQPHPEQSDLRRSLDAIRVLERSFGKNVFIAADNKFFVASFTISYHFINFYHAYLHVYHADCLRPISGPFPSRPRLRRSKCFKSPKTAGPSASTSSTCGSASITS